MATVDKDIADRVIAGEFDSDPAGKYVRIVKYTNAWGGESYGLEMANEIGRYAESEYVIDPQVYWERK